MNGVAEKFIHLQKCPITRPTTDIAKEGLFNILQSNRDLEGLKTLDLFGGTGSISFELASRGANDLTIVEKDSQMLAFIRKTAESLGLNPIENNSIRCIPFFKKQ